MLITSIDNEGMAKGFDLNLINQLKDKIEIPILFSGGMGDLNHLSDLFNYCIPDGICMSHVLHYNKLSIQEIRDFLKLQNIPTRI